MSLWTKAAAAAAAALLLWMLWPVGEERDTSSATTALNGPAEAGIPHGNASERADSPKARPRSESRLQAGLAASTRSEPASIAGTVTGPGGPAVGATVVVCREMPTEQVAARIKDPGFYKGQEWGFAMAQAVASPPGAGDRELLPAERETTTDAQGRFRLDALPDATWAVRATAKGLASAWALGIRPPRSGVSLELTGLGALEGEVIDRDELPIPGATIWLAGPERRRMQTDAMGRWRADDLGAGSYGIVLSGHLPAKSTWTRYSATVEPGRVARCDIRMPPRGVTVQGTVCVRGVGKSVMVSVIGDGRGHHCHSDAGGRFRLDDVRPGRAYVVAHIGTGEGGVVAVSRPVQVDRSVDPLGVDFDLGQGRFTGRVLDERGRAVAGARVSLLAAADRDTLLAREWMVRLRAEMRTDPDGRFEMPATPEPGAVVCIDAYGFVPVERDVAGTHAEVVLESGRELRVRVTDEEDGGPVAGAAVFAMETAARGGWFAPSRADAEGRTTLRLGRDPHVLHVQAGRFVSAAVPLGTADSEVAVQLRRCGIARVAVTAAGKPVSDAAVVFIEAAGRPLQFGPFVRDEHAPGTVTRADGTLVRGGLPPGLLGVVVTLPDGRTARRDADVKAGETTTVAVEF